MVLALSQTISWLGTIVITEGHGLESQRQQHRVRRDDQVVTIEVIQNSVDVTHAQVNEDEGTDVFLLGIPWCECHDQVRNRCHEKHMTDFRAEEVRHAHRSNSQVDSVSQLRPVNTEVEEPADGKHAEPDENEAHLILREIEHY